MTLKCKFLNFFTLKSRYKEKLILSLKFLYILAKFMAMQSRTRNFDIQKKFWFE